LIDEIAYAAAGGHLVFPLRVLGTAEGRGGEAPAQSVLSIEIAR
jgi:hypothetical protein